jgi:MoaA/NifB/PqqE/SkfB family radical SAM enzyme
LLIASHTLGNKNVAVSNGTLFQSDKAKRALKHLDLVAVSIDGRESFHDEIRHLRGAFDKMIKGVEILRDLGISFGFIHTTTEESWRDLLWLAEFAASKGAALLQLHPLELTGRALAEFSHLVPSQESLQKVFILGSYIDEKYTGKMKVQLDFLHRNIILQSPGTISFFGTNFELNKTNFSDAVKCLVIDQKGDVYPMSYGFAEYFRMGHISEVTEGRDIIADFINNKGRDMYRLIQKIFRMIEIEETDDLIVWTELIVKNSHSYRDAPSDSYNHPLATQRPC